MAKVMAIIPAAGQGKRMGNQVNKQFLCLAGLPVLIHTLRMFEKHPAVAGIIIVCREEEREYCQKELVEKYKVGKVLAVVAGGKERQNSVFNGLKALPKDTDVVIIHDGARPFLTTEIIDRTLAEAITGGTAVTAVPVKDTIKVAEADGLVISTPERGKLWQVQTPQVFRTELIQEAYEWAEDNGFLGTDDASLLEQRGQPVKLVLGAYDNIKITTPDDLYIGEAIIRARMSGQ